MSEWTLHRRASGEAYRYPSPERAWRDGVKLMQRGVDVCPGWVPTPKNPWRLYVKDRADDA